MPARHLLRAPLDHVPEQAHRRVDREAPLLLSDVLLEDVGLDRAGQPIRGYPLALSRDDVVGEHDRRRRVDRHRDADVAEVDPAEQRLHVVERVDGDALAADLTERARMVGVMAHQARHVERRAEPGLTVIEQVAKTLVGLLRGAEAGELAHRPQPPAIHRRVHAAREGIRAGQADLLGFGQITLAVERRDRDTRQRREGRVALGGRSVGRAPFVEVGRDRLAARGRRHARIVRRAAAPTPVLFPSKRGNRRSAAPTRALPQPRNPPGAGIECARDDH